MKSNKKKLLSILMCLFVAFVYMVPGQVFAAEGDSAEPVQTEEVATRAAGDGDQYLAFSSDVHNKSNNTSANRLGTFIDMVINKFGSVDYMAFCGDMADASASESNYWTYTSSDISVVTTRKIPACYTTGNHEWSPGQFSNNNNSTVKANFTYDGPATNLPEDARYQIYALGSASGSQSFTTDQISNLTSYLNTADASKPIIVLAHFPLHSTSTGSSGGWGGWGGRTTSNASGVIDALNNAVNSGKTVIYLWGHNHTNADSTEKFYDEFFVKGDSLNYDGTNSKTIQFYYGAAGCMSDEEYGSGSAAVKGKGLVIQFKESGYIGMDYFSAGGSVVTENDNAPHIVQEEVAATGITLDKTTATVTAGKTVTINATIIPSNATDRNITWSTSNSNVATVNNGVVTGVNAGGPVTITAALTSNTNIKATCQVTVEARVPGADTTYVQTDTFEDGKDYLIVDGNSGTVHVLTNEAGGSRQLKGLTASVVNGKITLSDEEAEVAAFTAELKSSQSGSVSAWLKNNGKYLYTNNANGLVVNNDQTNSDNSAKVWHYRSDKNLLWYFKDENNNDGYTDTSQTYKYYLSYSNGYFTDNHVSTTSLSSSSNIPAMYIFVEDDGTPTAVQSVSVSPTSLNLSVGKSATLTATVLPAKATNKEVEWSTSKSSVATVDQNGVVTGVSEGTAVITVTTKDGGKTATCNVTVSTEVTYDYVQTDTFEDGKDYLIVDGNSGTVHVLTNEAGGSRQLKGLTTSVVGGKITLTEEEAANAAFTAELKSSQSGSVSAWLKNNGKYLYTNSANGLVVNNDQTNSDNSAKVWHYRSDKNLLWYFKDENNNDGYTDTSQTYKYYLSYSNGNFTDNHVSTTSLSSSNNIPAMYIFVEDDGTPTAVQSVSVSPTSLNLKLGNSETLTATVLPAKATNKEVEWSTSKSSVATVDQNGVVTGVGEGTAVITVTTKDGGKTATCNVTVSKVITKTYAQTDTLEAGKDYLIVNGITGNVYVLSNETGSTGGNTGLKGLATSVVDGKITLSEEDIAKTEFTCELQDSSNANSTRLKIGNQYLYANNSGNLRLESSSIWNESSSGSSNADKHWHYIAKDGNTDKYLLWFFIDSADTDGSLGYTYATNNSPKYRYYLEFSNGVFYKGTATSASLQSTNTTPIYLFTEAEDVHVHSLTKVEAKVATCTEAGNTAYWVCSGCGKYFSDANGTTEITEGSWVIEATGHDYGAPTYEWSTDYKTCTAKRVCSHDANHVEEETVNSVANTSDATCTTGGTVTYTATFTNTAFVAQEKTVTVDALGHDWDEPTYTWADDGSKCTATCVCKRDSGHKLNEDATLTETIIKAATCDEAGSKTVTATFKDEAFETQTKTVEVAALGHDWAKATYEWADDYSSCTATRVCKNDAEHSETETVLSTSETREATCEQPAMTVYTATFKNPAFKTQTYQDKNGEAIGHVWLFKGWTWADDNTYAIAKYKCLNDGCGKVQNVQVDAKIETVEAQVGVEGSTTYTVTISSSKSPDKKKHTDSRVVKIPALPKPAAAAKITNLNTDVKTSSNTIVLDYKSKNAVKYKIRYRVDGGKWKTIKTTEKKYTIKNIKANAYYDIKVAGINKDGKQGKYTSLRRRYSGGIKFKVKSPSKGLIKVTAKAKDNLVGYQIRYNTNKTKTGGKTIKIKTTENLAKEIELTSGKTYYVWVRPLMSRNGKTYIGVYDVKIKVTVK